MKEIDIITGSKVTSVYWRSLMLAGVDLFSMRVHPSSSLVHWCVLIFNCVLLQLTRVGLCYAHVHLCLHLFYLWTFVLTCAHSCSNPCVILEQILNYSLIPLQFPNTWMDRIMFSHFIERNHYHYINWSILISIGGKLYFQK